MLALVTIALLLLLAWLAYGIITRVVPDTRVASVRRSRSHNSAREMARRRRQLERGIIRTN